jgi:hypothetical protein
MREHLIVNGRERARVSQGSGEAAKKIWQIFLDRILTVS